jgi:hypothetical protein
VTPWDYYATGAALVVIVTAIGLGRLGVALASAGVWAVLTARFVVRRLRGTAHTPRHIAEMVVTSALIPPLSVFWRLAGAVKFRVPFL